MNDKYKIDIGAAVSEFLAAISGIQCYLPNGQPEIPIPAEIRLLSAIDQPMHVSRENVTLIRSRLDVHQAYYLVGFAVRMAVYAARINEISILRAATVGLVFDENLVDYREILISLSIIEDCAIRLGAELESVVRPHIELASPERRDTIVKGYGSRPPEMRGLKVMKIAVSGSGKNLSYTRMPWF